MVNCAHGAKSFGGILCLLRSDWSLRWFGVCICTDLSEMGFALAFREGCRELASEVGRESERIRFKRSSRSIRARSRALRSIVAEYGLECFGLGRGCDVACPESELRGLPVSIDATSRSLDMEINGDGGFFCEEHMTVLEARSILYAVRCAENSSPPGRLLVFSGTGAL